jgi:cell division septum initiation protein DivIVA
MLQPHFSDELNDNGTYPPAEEYTNGTEGVNIIEELNRLEDLILYGFCIPFTGRTIVDEDKLIEQIDFIRLSLPGVFQEATFVLQQKQEVIQEAQEYGRQIIEAAQAKRGQILAESDILREAEQKAQELRRQVQQECEAMMQATLAEIDQKRRSCEEELEQLRRTAVAQAQEIENGADEYADTVLENMEKDLQDMLGIIVNGRQQLRRNMSPTGSSHSPHQK